MVGRRLAHLRVRAARGATSAGNVRGGGPLDHRPGRRRRPSSTSPGTSGSRPPGIRSGRRRSGCWRRPSGSCRSGSPPGGWSGRAAVADRGHRARRRCPASSRRRYFILLSAAYRRGDLSVVYPIARGTAPLLAVAIGVGRARRAAGRGRVDRGRRCCSLGFLVLQRPWRAIALARSRGGGADGRGRQRDPVRARDRRDDRDLQRDRPGRDAASSTRSPYAAILWVDLSGRARRCGSRSSPAATCCATAARPRPDAPRSVAG